MPQTKYELMAELRELNRGFPRLAISTMKRHELEAAIDTLKVTKSDYQKALADKVPAKRGPLGPRPIPVETTTVDSEEIKVPKRPVGRPSTKAKAEGTEEAKPSGIRVKSESVSVHFCSCPDCPQRRK
jgi:hypothetical protein